MYVEFKQISGERSEFSGDLRKKLPRCRCEVLREKEIIKKYSFISWFQVSQDVLSVFKSKKNIDNIIIIGKSVRKLALYHIENEHTKTHFFPLDPSSCLTPAPPMQVVFSSVNANRKAH